MNRAGQGRALERTGPGRRYKVKNTQTFNGQTENQLWERQPATLHENNKRLSCNANPGRDAALVADRGGAQGEFLSRFPREGGGNKEKGKQKTEK